MIVNGQTRTRQSEQFLRANVPQKTEYCEKNKENSQLEIQIKKSELL